MPLLEIELEGGTIAANYRRNPFVGVFATSAVPIAPKRSLEREGSDFRLNRSTRQDGVSRRLGLIITGCKDPCRVTPQRRLDLHIVTRPRAHGVKERRQVLASPALLELRNRNSSCV